ncbi:MAG: DUF559 domain-containing protein [Fimbriimonadales bacterium]|nr:DUF559 domain-containing protein [Fimbriimonadales bacterium]
MGAQILPIEQILPGQYVIGHDGKPHRVLRTFQREYHGRMVGLKHALCPHMLWLTEDHLVLAKLRPRTLGGNRDWSGIPIENRDRRRELRRQMTPTEKRLWAKLRNGQLGWKFRRQHSIGPFIADFYCREAHLVVEIDGDPHFTPEVQAYDAERDAYMRSQGLEVLRFTTAEIRQHLDAVLTLIEHRCRQRVESLEGAQWVPAGELQPGDLVFFGTERRAVPLEHVEYQWTREVVYDLEVEGAHSFLTEVCVVHNCGSGTTAVVAEKLGRRWIACDLSRFAIHTTRKRLLQIPNLRPFVVQNLGKYERQVWQMGAFGDGVSQAEAAARQQAYIQFILQLYHARPVQGYVWLHGVKGGRMVHVGSVDAPVSLGDVQQIVAEFRKAVGKGTDAPATNGIDILGWDFAFELNEVARQHADAAKVNLRFLRIPRDVMDKRAVEQGDIQFFELAALQTEVQVDKRKVTVKLTDFIIPPDDVPEDARRAVKHWSQWIDYWAVDWDFKGDAFHNQWQSYRTRKNKRLELQASHHYEQAGDYTILVKVIDILGNDTTKAIRVQVR